ncbi:CHAT domain-containing protein [Phytohabitans rumicis]|uniref:CHAT domain-containing protein n=1 Tax=Phytohabitans rumicis TaxID=1076125 RepID=A0A6V8KT37_9ACTN|nr:CHAT domain-containing protein [Phytohabitans rumicis]GFJ86590.1 hypothetical protein Prum_002320 [Phytohabitans rumicis]
MTAPDPAAAEELGRLGCALVAAADEDGDRACIDAGLAQLERAAAAAPEHPDRTRWWWALGSGYERRADEDGSVDDCVRAIDWYDRLHTELPPGDPDRGVVAIALASTHWSRFWLLRYGEAGGPHPSLLVRDVAVDVRRLAAGEADPRVAAYTGMILGLVALERHEITEDRADLDQGVMALAAALPGLPDDAPWIAMGAFRLAAAYRESALLDDDPKLLDLSIVAGRRAVELSDAGRPTWVSAHENQALCHGRRWELAGDRDDLDRAIAAWTVVLTHEDDGWAAEACARLLRERGDPRDLAEAVRLLERSLRDCPDEATAAARWLELGRTHHTRWTAGEAPGSLEAADRCVSRALRGGLCDEDVVSAHIARLAIVQNMVIRDELLPHDTVVQSAIRYRQLLAEARAALDRAVGADPDTRGILGGMAGFGEMWIIGHNLGWFDPARVRGLLTLAEQVRRPPELWPAFLDVANGLYEHTIEVESGQPAGGRGVERLAQALKSKHLTEFRGDLSWILSMAVHARGNSRGDLRDLDAMNRRARQDQPAEGDEIGPETEADVLALLLEAFQRGSTGDTAGFGALVQEAEWRLAELPQPPQAYGPVVAMLRLGRRLLAAMNGEPVPAVELSLDEPLPDGYAGGLRIVDLVSVPMSRLVRAAARGDLAELRATAAQLEALASWVPTRHPLRLLVVLPTALAHMELAQRHRGERAAAEQAHRYYAEACAIMRGPEHPLWPDAALRLAAASRLAGADPGPARESAMSALASHAQRVMLQAGTEHAIEAARAAAKDALIVAGWALAGGAHEDLVAALDAGRGLVLHAATASRDVADQLADRGHAALAAEWRATGGRGRDQLGGQLLTGGAGELPDDLRARVLRALGAGGVGEPVRVDQVARSLAAVGADALAYLVPATPGLPGAAVVVAASGVVRVVRLPWLVTGPGTPVERFARARAGSGVAGAALDELCAWAWQAATGTLVHLASQWRQDRPAHLVLVPMGVLALVPWHAAHRGRGRARRYAVQDMVFSYIPSARMLSAAARHEVRPIRSALVVGDPGGDLAFAGMEARAVHQAFYRYGRYLGRLADEPGADGTPAQVFDWIVSATGPSMLHLACHGYVDPRRPAEAHLALAGGARLTAGELIEASRVAELVIDQVFLAACTTNLAGEDYDEAFSLASAFLAAGAHTVFGSLWPVPDAGTSLLMFMLHHHLNAESRPPAEALHAAQLWMLDPGRRPPPGMPADLAAYCRQESLAHPVSWAGFTHVGR